MDFDLVAISPVAGFGIGERITDPDLVKAILADERESHVQRVAKAQAPAKAAPASKDA